MSRDSGDSILSPEYTAFYAYAYPAPEGFEDYPVKPEAAYFHAGLGEFILPYDALRNAEDPDSALMDFLQTTYEAAAVLANWDRAKLECDFTSQINDFLLPR